MDPSTTIADGESFDPSTDNSTSSIVHASVPKQPVPHSNFAQHIAVPTPKSSSVRSKAVRLVDGITAEKSRGKVLHLFSGPSSRPDGLKALLRAKGWECVDFDSRANGIPEEDLTRDDVWDKLMARVRAREFDYIVAGPPCDTFSHARERKPGPRPLRSFDRPYGLPRSSLYPQEIEQLRVGNLLALRTAEACRALYDLGGGFIVENPREWEGCASIWALDEYKSLLALKDVHQIVVDQCGFGAASQKPTRLAFCRVKLQVAAYS